jgi:hypothetical protein
MNKALPVLVAVIFLFSLLFASCKDDIVGDGGSPSNIVFPSSNVSYGEHVQALFNQTCALSGCHDDRVPQGELRLTDYGKAVLEIPGVVVPGSPDQSTLVLRIEGRIGQRMPLNRNPLNQNQISGIRKWIEEGAQNN